MRYTTYTIDAPTRQLVFTGFLSQKGKDYLTRCDQEIYNAWCAREKKPTSISPILTKTVLKTISSDRDLIDTDQMPVFSIITAFNNSNYSGSTCLKLFKEFKRDNKREFILVIMTEDFKVKFNVDPTYMTYDQFTDFFFEFVDVMEPVKVPRVHFIVLEDLAFEVDVEVGNNGSRLFLIPSK